VALGGGAGLMPTPNRLPRTYEEQQAYIDARIVHEDGHHVWQLALDRKGFPKAWDGQRCMGAHRLVFMHHYRVKLGFVDAVVVTCTEPLCVNPEHLATLPRADVIASPNACRRGHPRNEVNTTKHGCRKCAAITRRARLLKKRRERANA
jgi:hypothetical protein